MHPIKIPTEDKLNGIFSLRTKFLSEKGTMCSEKLEIIFFTSDKLKKVGLMAWASLQRRFCKLSEIIKLLVTVGLENFLFRVYQYYKKFYDKLPHYQSITMVVVSHYNTEQEW